jgi:hypothetical protein
VFENYMPVNSDIDAAMPVWRVLDLSSPVMHSVDMTKEGRQALAEAVRAERDRLGLSQGDLKGRGGPGVVTVGNVERCDDPPPSRGTLAAFDRAFGWSTGTAAGILAGDARRGAVAGTSTSSGLVSGSVGPARQGERPVGYDLDLEGLDEADIDDVRALIRAKRARKGLPE